MKGIREFFGKGGCTEHLTLNYYSGEIEAAWNFSLEDDESALQVIYRRETYGLKQDFWMYLDPGDAAVLSRIFAAFAESRGEELP